MGSFGDGGDGSDKDGFCLGVLRMIMVMVWRCEWWRAGGDDDDGDCSASEARQGVAKLLG